MGGVNLTCMVEVHLLGTVQVFCRCQTYPQSDEPLSAPLPSSGITAANQEALPTAPHFTDNSTCWLCVHVWGGFGNLRRSYLQNALLHPNRKGFHPRKFQKFPTIQ